MEQPRIPKAPARGRRSGARFVCVLALLVLAPAGLADPETPPPAEGFRWSTVPPSQAGFDADALGALLGQIPDDREHDLHSLLVARHGRLAVERYFNGYHAGRAHDLRSATKSITSLITGIAVGEGKVGLDQPLLDHLGAAYPEARVGRELSVRHLLTMSTGLDCHDRDRKTKGQEDRMYRSRDWVRYFLDLRRVEPPGRTTRYCTGGVVALGEAIAQAYGEDFVDLADRLLFGPLGIRERQWQRFDRKRKTDTGGHLRLTPRDLARVGQLVLQKGRWQGRQLVPEDWLEQSTRPQTECDGVPYGFLWWIHDVRYGERPVRVVAARGNGGQALFVVPELGVVAVLTAGYYNSEKAQITDQIFFRGILPALRGLSSDLQPVEPPP